MHYFWLISGLILAVVWLDRLRDAIQGRHNVADISLPEWDRRDSALPKLSIIIPARNEGPHIETALRSVLALDYPEFEVIAIDDRSTDNTGAVLDRLLSEFHSCCRDSDDHSAATRQVAWVDAGLCANSPSALRNEASISQFRTSAVPQCGLKVLHIKNLPVGWLGKPHAMYIGAQQASGEWLLFTDADVRFRPDALRRAIAYAESVRADHLVLFPTHELRSVGERMMFAVFSMLFVFGHRPWRVHDRKAEDYLGFGPFNLIRRSTYEAIGTAQPLRMEVIEDMKLGKLVKDHGFPQRVAYGPGLVPWRWFHGTWGIVRNLEKNLFASMQYRYGRALGSCLLVCILAVLPYVGVVLAPGWLRAPFAIAVAAIFALYIGFSRQSPVSPLYFVLHPVGTLVLVYAMLQSMAHAARHRGVIWRGTLYPLNELRKGLV